MVRLEDLQVFVRCVELGGLSAAARQLDITPAVASSALARLEAALDVRLLVRSTRRQHLSEAGERYLPHARAALQALADGHTELQAQQGRLSGQLRLSLPSDLGRHVLLPWLDRFQQDNPALRLWLHVSDRPADLFAQPLAAAIRYGTAPDSSLVAQPLAPDNRRVLCAAPAYLARHGRPRTPAELGAHNCLCYVWGEQVLDRWRFQLPGAQAQPQVIAVGGDRISDDAEVVRRWALAGLGLAYKSALDLADDLAAGRLVALFPPSWCEPAPLNLVCAHRSSLSPALTRLRDGLRDQLAERARLMPTEPGPLPRSAAAAHESPPGSRARPDRR